METRTSAPVTPGGFRLNALTDRLITPRGVALSLAIWLLAAVVAAALAARLPAPATTTPSLPDSVESSRAAAVLQRSFPGSHGAPALVVFHRAGG
jgi:uncharacterized membrane protein YdfJ with MMPL/SSD domain